MSLAFRLCITVPRGTVLVGGYTAAPAGLDVVHARDDEGTPILPASAMRGALRETCEALLRGANRPACAGGTGVVPPREAASADPAVPHRCTLGERGRPCDACVLFGSQGWFVGANRRGSFSALRLGDARLDVLASQDAAWALRHGVALERSTRSALDERLFNREAPAPGGRRPLRFLAHGELVAPWPDLAVDEIMRWLSAAAMATTHLGSSRSRGLGRVDMRIESLPATAPSALPSAEAPASVQVRLRLETPAAIGVTFPRNNIRDTRTEIPGSALRGAIGFALAEALAHPDDDAALEALVNEDHGARFDFCYPCDRAGLVRARDGIAMPWPRTARTCKDHPGSGTGHGIVDTLLDRVAVAIAVRAGKRLIGEVPDACPRCDAPWEHPTDGGRGAARSPKTRAATRVALERHTGSAKDRALFTLVFVERETEFIGSVRGVPEPARSRLARAWTLPLSVGRGKSQRRGALEVVEVKPLPALDPLMRRAEAFDEALANRLTGLGLAEEAQALRGRLIPITLRAPLLIQGEAQDGDGERTLANALPVPVRCVVKARRFGVERGWDQRPQSGSQGKGGVRAALRSVLAGGVFVVELPEGNSWRDLLTALDVFEGQGAGPRRHQGFGRVLLFDPFSVDRAVGKAGGEA